MNTFDPQSLWWVSLSKSLYLLSTCLTRENITLPEKLLTGQHKHQKENLPRPAHSSMLQYYGKLFSLGPWSTAMGFLQVQMKV